MNLLILSGKLLETCHAAVLMEPFLCQYVYAVIKRLLSRQAIENSGVTRYASISHDWTMNTVRLRI